MIHISLDVMGGDHGPNEILQGAFLALKDYPIHLHLVGQRDVIEAELASFESWPYDQTTIQHAPDVVTMSESPALAYRKKKESSIQIGLNLVRDKVVGGFVSAGNTGAVMATSTLTLGRIPHVERPAIAVVLPSETGPFVILDMGSNMDSKSQHLSQFAIMGHFFAKFILHIDSPRVGLLNIGEEEDKGNMATLEAYQLIKQNPQLQFVGNIEGKDVLLGKADVVVCDGFVGNTLLKFGEGVTAIFVNFFKSEASQSWKSLLGLWLMKSSLKRFLNKFDYQEYGGAPLLGVNGVSIVAHGKSKRLAIKHAIRTCCHAIEGQMIQKITGAF